MATYVPSLWQVWNEIDSIGLLLNLTRLEGESNATYKRRLFDVFVHRADASYLGLIYGITRELGLSLFRAMTITPVWNPSGTTFLGANPIVEFEETKCYLYNDYTDTESGLISTLDRYEADGGAYTLAQLATSIAATGYFAVSLNSQIDSSTRAMTIFNQSSISSVVTEEINVGSTVIDLRGERLLSNSVSVISSNLRERVSARSDLKRFGQYYIDYDYGILYTTEAPAAGSLIRYRHKIDTFEVLASPVILHNLQSADFKTKMFEQITGDDGETNNGLPTAMGSDIINELISVFPAGFGL